jgi:SAM-dependent methyltransferase
MSDPVVLCPLCHERTEDVITNRLRHGPGHVYQCGRCDHGFLLPDTARDLNTYYTEQYRQEYSHRAEGSTTNAAEIFDTYSKFQADRLKIVKNHLHAGTRFLEIGASAGQFLVHVANSVAVANAVELDPACCSFIESRLGIQTDAKSLSESKFAGESYDVVCSFHVMEHVVSPIDFLRDIHAVLVPGGKAFVEVPNRRDALLSIWDVGAYRDFYYRDVHLHYFSAVSGRFTAEAAGFTANECSVEYLQDYNLLNHLNWITNNAPQATCEPGMSPIGLDGTDPVMGQWLSARLVELDHEYRERLVSAGVTSNLMLVLSRGLGG